jgi:hypothetical protein
VLIEKIDMIGLQPVQRPFDGNRNMLGAAVAFAAHLLPILETKTELGRDHDLGTPALECAPEELLVRVGAIHLGRVEEVASQVDGAMQCGNRFLFVRRTVGLTHAHAAEADHRDFETLTAQFAHRQHDFS